MKVRYQADADLKVGITRGVKRLIPEIDFQSSDEAGFEGVGDLEILTYCADEGRILVSHDRRTMPFHFADFLASRECPGVVIVSKKMEIALAVEALVLIWAASSADEYRNGIIDLRRLIR